MKSFQVKFIISIYSYIFNKFNGTNEECFFFSGSISTIYETKLTEEQALDNVISQKNNTFSSICLKPIPKQFCYVKSEHSLSILSVLFKILHNPMLYPSYRSSLFQN